MVNDALVAMITESAPTAWAAISAPSITRYGSARRIARSLNEPGSPSAALTTTVVGDVGGASWRRRCATCGRPGTRRRHDRADRERSIEVDDGAGVDAPRRGRPSPDAVAHPRGMHRFVRQYPRSEVARQSTRYPESRPPQSRTAYRETSERFSIAPGPFDALETCPRVVLTRAGGAPRRDGRHTHEPDVFGGRRRKRHHLPEHRGVGAHRGVVEAAVSTLCAPRQLGVAAAGRPPRRTATTRRRSGWDRTGRKPCVDAVEHRRRRHHLTARGQHVAAVGPHGSFVHARQRHPRVDAARRHRGARGSSGTRSRPWSG